MSIEEIEKIDSQISDLIRKDFHLAEDTFNKVGFINTGRAFVMFAKKVNYIKESVFSISKMGDVYSASVLFRVLIEHSLKFVFMFIRHTKEQTDDIGFEYYHYYEFSESLKLGRSWLDSFQVFDDDREEKLYEAIITKYPDLKNISRKDALSKVNQFSLKESLKYIKQNIQGIENSFGWLDLIMPNYSELSSFIHAGPSAEKRIALLSNQKDKEKELENICNLSIFLARTVDQFLYVLLCELDNKFKETLSSIDKMINEIKIK